MSITVAGLILPTGNACSATTNSHVFTLSQTAGFPDQEMGRLSISELRGANRKYFRPSLPLLDVVGSVGVKSFARTGVYFQPSKGPGRFADGESASWRFLNTIPAQFTDFELHINAIYDGSSVKFTPEITPEPSAYALLGLSALLIAALYRGKAGRA